MLQIDDKFEAERKSKKLKYTSTLRKIGFCGADDSVSPVALRLICESYNFIEFGVLFRPDKEGEPRYATKEWVKELGKLASTSGGKMELAAHLCGARVNEVLSGNDSFLSTLPSLGFKRVQINATAVNGVDTTNLSGSVSSLGLIISRFPNIEFILQKNEETSPLCDGILKSIDRKCGGANKLPPNVTMLVDESKGTGVLATSWPTPPDEFDIGYAGGIGPSNIRKVVEEVLIVGNGRKIWIDMESSLRSNKNGKDVFDLDKCFQCIEAVCDLGVFDHPPYMYNEK